MITLTNDFHRTTIKLKDICGKLSRSQVRKAKKALCYSGFQGSCKCSGEVGTRGTQYWQQADHSERQRVVISVSQDGSAEILPYI